MRKNILVVVAICVLLLAISIAAVYAGNSRVLTLDEEEPGVLTSAGTIDLPEGTKLGGSPTNYITLSEDIYVMTVEEGEQTIELGTLINCDHPPGTPDPCGE